MKIRCLRGIIALLEFFPLSFLMTFFSAAAALYSFFDKKHRKIAEINLQIAFPGMGGKEMKTIIRNSYRNMSWTIAEIIKLGKGDEEAMENRVHFEGLENILEPSGEGKGVFAVSGHFGNWELMSHAFGKKYKNIDVVVRPQKETFINDYIIRKRMLGGNRVIEKFDSVREIIRRTREGRIIGILMDQDTHINRGTFVDFFGLPACTLDAIPRIAFMTGAKMVPVFPFRDIRERTHHIVRFYPPVNPESEDKEEFVRLSLERIHTLFEKVITERPEEWLWFHRRWRTRPLGDGRIYDI